LKPIDFLTPIVEYRRYSATSLPLRLGLVFGMLVGSLVLFIIGFWRMSSAYARFGPAAAPAWGQNWLMAAVLLFGLTVLCGIWVVWTTQMGLTIQTTGIIVKGLLYSRFIAWQDIVGISYVQEQAAWLPVWRTNAAYIWFLKGRPLFLGNLVSDEKMPECVTRLKAELYTRLETTCRHLLQVGESVRFGPLLINQTGMGWTGYFRSPLFVWQDIEKIDVEHGQLLLFLPRGRKKHFAIGKIPNFEIFLSLLREAEKIKQ